MFLKSLQPGATYQGKWTELERRKILEGRGLGRDKAWGRDRG